MEREEYENLLASIDDLAAQFCRNRAERNLRAARSPHSWDEIGRLWVSDEDGSELADRLAARMRELREHNLEVRRGYG